jgi:hypothetical protein
MLVTFRVIGLKNSTKSESMHTRNFYPKKWAEINPSVIQFQDSLFETALGRGPYQVPLQPWSIEISKMRIRIIVVKWTIAGQGMIVLP